MVTNVILATPVYMEDELSRITEEINTFFNNQKGLVSCDDKNITKHWYGGSKSLEAEVFVGAFNYIDLQEFIYHLKNNVDWGETYGELVQLIVKEQEDEGFKIIIIKKDPAHV